MLQALLFDGRLEEVPREVLHMLNKVNGTGKVMYKASKAVSTMNHLTGMPCGVCPVANQCHDNGVISPKTCIYMTQWLSMDDSELF